MNSSRWDLLIAGSLPCQGNWRASQSAINCRQILIESIEFWHILIWRLCYHFPLSRLYSSWVKSSWGAVGLRLTLSQLEEARHAGPPLWSVIIISSPGSQLDFVLILYLTVIASVIIFSSTANNSCCLQNAFYWNQRCLFSSTFKLKFSLNWIKLNQNLIITVFVSTSNHHRQVRNSAPAVM